MHDDKDLLAAFYKQEPWAWNRIFSMYYKAITNHAARIIEFEDDAEDIAQECFKKLAEEQKKGIDRTFVDLKGLESFLFICAKNAAFDHLRKEKRKQQFFKEFKQQETETDARLSQDWEMRYQKCFEEIIADIDQMAPQRSRVMKLTLFGHLKIREIMAIMELEYTTVHTHRSHGLEYLKSKYGRLPLFDIGDFE